MVWGVIFAIIVSMLFSIYILPRKFSKLKPELYTALLGVTFFIVTVIWYLIAWAFNLRDIQTGGDSLFSIWHLLSCLLGVLWGVGGILLNTAIDKCGITRSNQWKNLQGPIGSLLMLIVLNEVSGWQKILFLILGMLAIFSSALCFTIKKEGDKVGKKSNLILGVVLAVLAAVILGSNSFVAQMIVRQGFVFSYGVYFSLFVVITSFVIYGIKGLIARSKAKALAQTEATVELTDKPTIGFKQLSLPLIAGALYGIANIFSALSKSLIPGSIAFSIVQLNALWVVLIGVFIFKEIDFKKNWLRIMAGMLLAITAIVLLVLAL